MYKKKVMNELFTLAQDIEPHSGARVICALVYKNKIISYGFNHKKSHPFHVKFSSNKDQIYFHAETHAIKNAINKHGRGILKDSDLYVLRIKTVKGRKYWMTGIAKPCSTCFNCIKSFNINTVYYTTDTNVRKYTPNKEG